LTLEFFKLLAGQNLKHEPIFEHLKETKTSSLLQKFL
jgi:hypothetical protein